MSVTEPTTPAALAAAPFAAAPGAVVDDEGLAHVGSPNGEQRALAAGRALAPLAARTVLTVSGPDRLTWLDSITSQALAGLAPGESTELLVLDPQGHIEHAASVVDDGERTWLIVDRARAASLAAWLTRMRFRLRVEVQDASDTHRVVGGTAAAIAPLRAAAVWHDPWPGVSGGGWGYAVTEPHPGAERDWSEAIVDTAEYDALAAAAASGAQPVAGHLAADALRVAAWRPRADREAGSEGDARTLPHEVDWLRTAVHLDKGCYRGQETVAKVHFLGRPPRRIVLLDLDGSLGELPAAGSTLSVEGDANAQTVGRISSVAIHHEDGPIALALVKRSLAEDATLVVQLADGQQVTASATTIVSPTAGRAADVPRLPRLERRGQ